MAWIEISVETTGDLSETLSEVFNSAGALSVTVLDGGDEPILEPAPGETPLWSRVRLTALFNEGVDTQGIRQQLQAILDNPDAAVAIQTLEDRDWSTTWRDTFSAMRFGERLWVCPVGELPPDPEAIVVHMDPGMAFGTGTHATTALCLEWLAANPPQDQAVIDFGCGSGILAIAAHKLGANLVTAVDIDPQALVATRENARRNDCDMTVAHPEPASLSAAHLVVANILANPLVELAADLSRCVHPGGMLVMTGILAGQAAAVMAAYRGQFEFAEPVCREEWMLLEGRRRDSVLSSDGLLVE